MSKTSNTGYTNISFDVSRNRFRCEMRVGGVSRTARVTTIEEALIVREQWSAERALLIQEAGGSTSAVKVSKSSPSIEIIYKECTVSFD